MLTFKDDTIELPINYNLLPYNKIGRNYIKKHLYTNQDWEKYKKDMYAMNDTKKVFLKKNNITL